MSMLFMVRETPTRSPRGEDALDGSGLGSLLGLGKHGDKVDRHHLAGDFGRRRWKNARALGYVEDSGEDWAKDLIIDMLRSWLQA